jgi:energy-coupling factor transport system permease protein
MRRRRSGYPGQYIASNGFIHRLPAGAKLATSLAMSLGTILAGGVRGATVALALLFLGLYALSNLDRRAWLQDGALVAWQAPLLLVVYLYREGLAGIAPALTVSARFALFYLPCLWLQRTTPAAALIASLRGVVPTRLAFLLTMCLRFVPLLARDAGEIYWLQRLRGARIGLRDLRNPRNWVEAARCLAIPLLIRSHHLTDQLAVAAEQRGVSRIAVQ